MTLGVGRSLKKLLETTKRDGLLSEPVKPKERTLRQDPWFTCIKTIVQQLLKPEAKATTRIKAQLTKKCAVQKHCYDKSSKPLVQKYFLLCYFWLRTKAKEWGDADIQYVLLYCLTIECCRGWHGSQEVCVKNVIF